MFRYSFQVNIDSVPTNACLVTFHRKCGKANCRCTQGQKHPFKGLKYRVLENDRLVQKVKYLRDAEVHQVRQQLYSLKGLEILERDDNHIFTIAKMFPDMSGKAIHIQAYETFRQKKTLAESLTAN